MLQSRQPHAVSFHGPAALYGPEHCTLARSPLPCQSMLSAAIGAAGALLFWTALGLSISRRIVSPVLAMPIAPALGWAMHSAATLPIFLLLGFSAGGVALTATAASGGKPCLSFRSRDAPVRDTFILRPAYIAGALLALIPAATVAPEHVVGSVLVGAPIFDHAKVPIIDVMVRLGLPPANPFFGEFGERGTLAYYYLWHFSAAQLAIVSGLTGWAAVIALTWFSAFASLSVMMGLASWFGRRSAAEHGLCSSRQQDRCVSLASMLGAERLHGLLANSTGFAGWLFQSAWSQHLMSASCTVIALLLIARVAEGPTPLLFVTLVLVVVAAFESSIWVGGLTLLTGAVIAAGVFSASDGPAERSRFALNMVGAAVLSVALTAPVLIDEIAALPTRSSGFPFTFGSFPVLGSGSRNRFARFGYMGMFSLCSCPLSCRRPTCRVSRRWRCSSRHPNSMRNASMTWRRWQPSRSPA